MLFVGLGKIPGCLQVLSPIGKSGTHTNNCSVEFPEACKQKSKGSVFQNINLL
jgi:hypothetical protein